MTANLQAAIRRIDGAPGTSALPLLAQRAGVDRRLISRVLAGQPINGSAYLKLCGSLGLDPVTGETVPVVAIGEIEWEEFAYDVMMGHKFSGLTIRACAKIANIKPSTYFRATRGLPISAENYLAICSFAELHPHYFTKGFTGNIPSNSEQPRPEATA